MKEVESEVLDELIPEAEHLGHVKEEDGLGAVDLYRVGPGRVFSGDLLLVQQGLTKERRRAFMLTPRMALGLACELAKAGRR